MLVPMVGTSLAAAAPPIFHAESWRCNRALAHSKRPGETTSGREARERFRIAAFATILKSLQLSSLDPQEATEDRSCPFRGGQLAIAPEHVRLFAG